MIASVQQNAPEILTALQERQAIVPQTLEKLCDLAESIVDGAQMGSNDGTISFRRAMTTLRSEIATLRESRGPLWQRNEDSVTQCINNIVKQVSQLSSHLE